MVIDMTKVKEFTHESGFNSVQGKYSLACDTRGLVIACEEYCGDEIMKREVKETSNLLKVNEYGQIVHPPFKPEKPDTSKWKRMTPKREGILAEYREAKAKYDHDMVEWLKLPYLYDGTTKDERILEDTPRIIESNEVAVFEFPCGKWHKGFGGNQRRELPYDMVEHHQMEIKEFEEGNWTTALIDQKWLAQERAQMRKEYRYGRQKFFRKYDTTVQLTLFNPGVRQVEEDVIRAFEDNPNLGFEYLKATIDGYRPCIHGSVNIKSEYILLTPSQREEINRRLAIGDD